MVKLNKIYLLILIVTMPLFSANYMVNPYCLCSPQLTIAFNSIHEEIIDDNIVPIENNLKKYNEKVKEDIKRVEMENKLLEKEIKLATQELLVLKQKLQHSKQNNKILSIQK